MTVLTLHAEASNIVIRMSLSAFAVNGPVTAQFRIDQPSGTPVPVTYMESKNRVRAPEAEIFFGTEQALDRKPYSYVSPQFVFSALLHRLSR